MPSGAGLECQAPYQITSGTGVYRKAKGSGALTGVENISSQPAAGFVTLNGQLSY